MAGSIGLKAIVEGLDTPLEPGQTVRVSHEDCFDSRRRMYITRVLADPTKIIAFCHNCQGTGLIVDNDMTPYRDARHNFTHKAASAPVEYNENGEVVPPRGMLPDLDDWPTYAKAWAWKNKLYTNTCLHYGIQFDPNTDRVYLPRYTTIKRDATGGPTERGVLKGYQLRAVAKGDSPKYLTCISNDSAIPWTRIREAQNNSTVAVIVEDLASGISIMESYVSLAQQPPDVLVNYGVKVDPVMMHAAARRYTTVLVWLDNDSILVQNQAKLMVRTMQLYGLNKAGVLEGHSDPKHYDAPQIISIIGRV